MINFAPEVTLQVTCGQEDESLGLARAALPLPLGPVGNNCKYPPLTVWEVVSAHALQHRCSPTPHVSRVSLSVTYLPKVSKSPLTYAMAAHQNADALCLKYPLRQRW